MTKPINTESIEKATGKSWQAWVAELDARGARDMTHKDLARSLYDQLDGQLANHGWWAQGITVAYEQHIGKRVPGQLADGKFELAVSKTIDAGREELFATVVTWFENQPDLAGQVYSKPRSSQTPKRSTWRCDFADGSKFSATVEAIASKSKLVLAHTAIPSAEQADNWKQYWREVLDEIAGL